MFRSKTTILTVLLLLAVLAAGCGTLSGLPPAQDRLIFQGQVASMTGEPANDRLVVAFLNGREAGRAVSRCSQADCTFALAVPWPTEAGAVPAPVDLGQIPEGESRQYQVPARPGEPNRAGHTYVVQVLAGDKNDLPPEFLTGKLGMLPDGQVVVITAESVGKPREVARPSQAIQWPPGIPRDRTFVALLLLSCCGGLVAFLCAIASIVLVPRWLNTPPSG